MQVGDVIRSPDVVPGEPDMLTAERRDMPQIILGVCHPVLVKH